MRLFSLRILNDTTAFNLFQVAMNLVTARANARFFHGEAKP